MTEEEQARQDLLELTPEDLDELVHDAAGQLAAHANNHGVEGQLKFLHRDCGWKYSEIWKSVANG